jgi:general secretion pathway protein D
MVADNQQAKIQVGDSVPTIGQSAILGGTTTNTITTSVQYIDTGIILTVTPRINASGLVTLEVQQEVSNASTTTTSGVNSPTISKRTAKSFVTVQSGETTVLGGLIQDNKTYATSGVPFLSEIPVLGALFGSQGVNAKKTELVVLITPKIAANVAQAKTISDEFRRKLTGIGEMMQDMKEREVHSSSVSIPQEK